MHWLRPKRLPSEARKLTFRPDQKPGDRHGLRNSCQWWIIRRVQTLAGAGTGGDTRSVIGRKLIPSFGGWLGVGTDDCDAADGRWLVVSFSPTL